jgi:hypothetical protein
MRRQSMLMSGSNAVQHLGCSGCATSHDHWHTALKVRAKKSIVEHEYVRCLATPNAPPQTNAMGSGASGKAAVNLQRHVPAEHAHEPGRKPQIGVDFDGYHTKLDTQVLFFFVVKVPGASQTSPGRSTLEPRC